MDHFKLKVWRKEERREHSTQCRLKKTLRHLCKFSITFFFYYYYWMYYFSVEQVKSLRCIVMTGKHDQHGHRCKTSGRTFRGSGLIQCVCVCVVGGCVSSVAVWLWSCVAVCACSRSFPLTLRRCHPLQVSLLISKLLLLLLFGLKLPFYSCWMKIQTEA